MEYKIDEETLRDGCHGLKTAFSAAQTGEIARELDRAGVYAVDVGLGLGIGSPGTLEYIRAARPALRQSKLCTLLVPGAGTMAQLEEAAEAGLEMVRIAVVCSRTDQAAAYIERARELGLETGVFLMVSHMLAPGALAAKAQEASAAGAEFICIGDSIGAMVEEDVAARVRAARSRQAAPLGIHTHNSLGLAVANSVAGLMNGCEMLDASLEGLGAGAGNANLQAVAAVCAKMGIGLGVDLERLNAISARYVRPAMDRPLELLGAEIESAFHEDFPESLRPFA